MKILVFGNPLIEEDNLAVKIGKVLKKDFNVFFVEKVEELLNYQNEKIIILDVVKNIKEITIINDIDQLKEPNLVSLHDFDLGFFLKLLKELNMIEKIKIIGLPQNMDEKKALKEVKNILKKF